MLEQEHFTHIPNFGKDSSPSKLRMAPLPTKSKTLNKNLINDQYEGGDDPEDVGNTSLIGLGK
jgi:hypothetical protein